MKQTSLGLLQYSQDYDDRMPGAKWMDGTYPYVKNAQVYHCPELTKTDASFYGYALERSLAGQQVAKVRIPEKQDLEFESSLTYKNAKAPIGEGLIRPGRHIGGNNVSFLDGHAKWLADVEAARRWLGRNGE